MRQSKLGATVLALALSGTAAFGQLPLDEAVSRALAKHPDVLAARQRVVQAQTHLAGAKALPNPELDLGHGQNVSNPGAANTDQDIQLTQRLNVFGQRQALTKQARLEAVAPQIELRLTELDITYRVRSAWYGLQGAQASLALAEQTRQVATTFARLADAQYKAGDVPLANVLRSQFEEESARQALLIAQTDVKVQAATLNTLLQQPPEAPLVVPPLSQLTLKSFDRAALLQHLERQPEVESAQARVEAQRAGIAVAQSAARPEVVVVYAHNQLQNWLGGNSYRVGVVFPLWDNGQLRASVREARTATTEKEAALSSAQQQVTLGLTTAFYLQEQARQLVPRTGEEQLQRALRLYQLAETGYREGATSYLNVLDALGVLRTAYQSYLKALTDYNLAEAALERALGSSLPPPTATKSMRYEPPTLRTELKK